MSIRALVGFTRYFGYVILAALLVTMATPALAVPVATAFVDSSTCDPLAGSSLSDELGNTPPFPAGEQIASFDLPISLPVCISTKIFGLNDAQVTIINLNSISFTDLWYVAEPATTFTNVDGTINGMLAFKIDTLGVNTPLQGESINANGIFEPGEAWRFIVQDFLNSAGLPASAFSEIGVPSNGPNSAASIVANPVPEPGTLSLFALGVAGLAVLRRARPVR